MPVESCPVCGKSDFDYRPVLWSELIEQWDLSDAEVNYINRQQGFYCAVCMNNMRALSLANAVLTSYQIDACLNDAVETSELAGLRVLEINQAGALTTTLSRLAGHKLVAYPEYDLTELDIESSMYDLVIHSDTLEHVPDPKKALSECKRVLKPRGRCIFTVPVIVQRLSRSRKGLPDSYHGESSTNSDDLIVHTEFGADVWTFVIESGFTACVIHSLEYPAGLAIEARL